jgi:hypothetical protein
VPTTYLLLPSPLLGAATWSPVAEVLRGGGARVVVASTAGCSSPEQVLAAYVAALPAEDGADVVLVPHSNAGYYAPIVAERAAAAGVVYVDAALPPETGPTVLAPPDLYGFLVGLADDDGVLPPWTRWWGDAGGLFPDDATRAEVEAGQPRLPLAYFRGSLRPPPDWAARPGAYLAFGDTYVEERARATRLGWPVRRLDGGHLHLLHNPTACAAAVSELRARIT